MPRHLIAVLVTTFLLLGAGTTTAPSASAQTLADVAQAARSAGLGLFGSSEIRSASLAGLPQWRRVLKVMAKERKVLEQCTAQQSRCKTPQQKAWRGLIRSASGLSRKKKLDIVNRFFNKRPYIPDSQVFGTSEYWATPAEFLSRSGDCEDFAIAKFFALRQLGFKNEEMRIVILWDEIRALGHAVLAVYNPSGTVVLDNLSSLIVPHSRYKNYIPQYSMNETTRWAHVSRKSVQTAWAKRN